MDLVCIGHLAQEKEPGTSYDEKPVFWQKYDPDRKHRARPKNLKFSGRHDQGVAMKRIQTERLIVRNFTPEDWGDLQEYVSQPEVLVFEEDWDPSDKGCQRDAAVLAEGDAFWAVELRETGKMIGHVFFARTEPEHFLTNELGYIFSPAFAHRGYATEACRALISWGFQERGLHPVVGKCSPENTPSVRLVERLPMRREGFSLQAATIRSNPDGRPLWWDEYRYAVLADEWTASN